MPNLLLPYPPTVNHYYAHTARGVHISATGRTYRKAVAKAVASARAAGAPLHGPLLGRLKVTVLLCPPDERARDIDNPMKALLDAITHTEVWRDDAQIDELRIVRGDRFAKGAAVVRIDELPAYKSAKAA